MTKKRYILLFVYPCELKDVGVQSEEGLQELALRCSYQKTRTIGSFRVLGYDEMLEIYRLANH